ncbi:MAG: nucleotidyltransferase family protein [Acaryochloridaceae cyanobacterium CSU_3_4]|nr:nucleotidyltransferase family protein [Acaryochloridaceae cyanobacterium CSU_3_4]
MEKPINELLRRKREEILEIAAKHGAFNVRVFGSVARGEADEQSDIDFLVDYSLDKVSSWFPAGLVLELETLLGRKVDVATEKALKERIREEVLQQAVPL